MAKAKTATTVKKAECPVTRAEFTAGAGALNVSIGNDKGGGKEIAEPRTFKSNRFGWYTSGKMLMPVGGKQVRCQVTCSIVVVGSLDAK